LWQTVPKGKRGQAYNLNLAGSDILAPDGRGNWRHCRECSTSPKTNRAFWDRKRETNIARDKRVTRPTQQAFTANHAKNQKSSAPGGGRTHNLWLRRPALYPVELRVLVGEAIKRTRGAGSSGKGATKDEG
jgi:hypothetical protein